MFEHANLAERRNVLGDWILRGSIALVFLIFGAEKFPADPGSHWVKLFAEIGAGQWFRYATGIIEMLGAVLVLIPRAVSVGLALLICTMLGAVGILVFHLGRPADAIVSGIFAVGLITFFFSRRGA